MHDKFKGGTVLPFNDEMAGNSAWNIEVHHLQPGVQISGVLHRGVYSYAFHADIGPIMIGQEPQVSAVFDPRNAVSEMLYDQDPNCSRELFAVLMFGLMHSGTPFH